MIHVATAAAALVLLSGELLTLLEPTTVPGGFWQGVWWAAVTVTTVGYGDIVPQTTPGRVLAVILMLTGLGVVSTLAASISAYFIGHSEQADVKNLVTRLDRIEAMLGQLTSVEAQRRSADGGQPISAGRGR